ncbi:Exocyst complex component S5 [Exophiala xenobiotica]|uniref:Exocyst complex component SEC5 n=1 Tax=Lithohypha guttulata TaxID=1690604 RepID=A0ABR0KCR2_9EURO|nr:Exocyst complex component S5 [Lithohypha guttulata]KAK5319869.1 Exocyst complex component S5 [Exophiala xenobiotica]
MYATQGSADQNVLNYYNLQDAFPTEWPTELDQSDEEENDTKAGIRRSKSRYSALERAASDRRTLIPGSQKTREGKANLVQKDESDPLGANRSVLMSLKQRGLPIEQDVRMRNRFLLSSTTFAPALFLSQTHSDASTNDLIQGLRFLEQSIDQKSASLKVLVETNFERFVRAKATIDNVYTEMRNQGMQPQESTGPPSPRGLRHSRQVSRQSGTHQRITSTGSIAPPQSSKNALRKETEYGVKGVKGPLLEVSQKAEDVWGPALGGREREASLKAVAEAVDKDRSLYELGGEMNLAAQQKNYERVVQLCAQARTYANQASALGEQAAHTGQALTDEQVHKLLVTGRMWADVQEQVKSIKKDIWRRLSSLQNTHQGQTSIQGEEHMELIGILLELGVEDNPIWVWLLSRYDNLKNKIAAVTERSKVEIEILRRRLAAAEAPSPESSASYIRLASQELSEATDRQEIIDFWKTVSTYVNKLLSLDDGLLGEIIEFWEAARSFIDGSKQKALPVGYEGESRKHHRLSDAGVHDLSHGAVELVSLLRDALYALFADTPTEDISSLFSPLTGGTPKTPATPMFSPSEGRLGSLDDNSMPLPSPRKGEAWEDYAFWPPHSNALSAVQYVSNMLTAIGSGAGEMMTIDPVQRNGALSDKIRLLVNAARDRCLGALCLAWSKDSENCRLLEDWLRSAEKRNQTRLPVYFTSYERTVLNGLQQILYFTECPSKARSLLTPPSSKNIQLVRQKFTESIFSILTGMHQNSEQATRSDEDEWVVVSEAFQHATGEDTTQASYSIDASNRNVRMLLTMSNLKALQSEHVPNIIQLFESTFTVKLTGETDQINKKSSEVDKQLFQSYTRPTITYITRIIKDGINSPSWEPKTTRPDQVSPYVYASLMVLVNIHTEASTTVVLPGITSSTLLHEILSYLLENMSQGLLDGFKERKPNRYSLAALIQATLDTEFIAQTMSQYASKKVGGIQNEIYVELDKRTTNDARADLQKELGVMRGVLKKLRESSRNSFGCFKRARSDKPRAERQATDR